MKRTVIFLLFSMLLSLPIMQAAENTVVAAAASPGGVIRVELLLRNDSLLYRAFRNQETIVALSHLGIKFMGRDFTQNIVFKSAATHETDETYTLPSGKRSLYRSHYRELTAIVGNVSAEMRVVFRIYDDGFAFRYSLPATGSIQFRGEWSEVNIHNYQRSWIQEYTQEYSWYYRRRIWDFSDLPERILSFPALIKSGDTYLLLSEAANDSTYASAQLIPDSGIGAFHIQPVGNVTGLFPLATPWRVVMAGSLATIMESSMIENLNEQTSLADLSWIRPGRTSWDWGGEDAYNTVGWDIAKRYIDLAKDMKWEYFTLDDGWNSPSAGYTLRDIVDYAAEQGLSVILWVHQNWLQNSRTDMHNKLSAWKNTGIKGVKVDFWTDDTQETMRKYENLLAVTGELQLLVDLHGCTKPSGLRRKYPHLLTNEAVLGNEFYIQDNPEMVNAMHNVNLTMTRNPVGPMDFTPCDFARKNGRIQQVTTWAHQLAQTVAYESGIQFLVDAPQNYKYHVAESFLRRLPVAWDDIKVLEAQPDSFATIARRKGDDWYIASLSAKTRTLHLTPDFLENGKSYHAYIYRDGDCPSEIAFEYQADVSPQTCFDLPVLAAGGAVIHLSVGDDLSKPRVWKYEAENAYAFLLSKPTDPDGKCSGGKYVEAIVKRKMIEFQNVNVDRTGTYALTVYYMTNGERSAYVKINGESDPLYYSFVDTHGKTGNYLAHTTIVVSLNAGNNTIELGNTNDYIPNIDRITLKSTDDDTLPLSFRKTAADERIAATCNGRDVAVQSSFAGRFTIFDTTGKKLMTGLLKAGENRFRTNLPPGVYIINASDGAESCAYKIAVSD
jgi:alpha-glucosidase